jgi:hypothetical protein
MKKKILLIIMMFMFITNVNALTFNIDVTNIENEGNNGTIGEITNIDVTNKEVDALFQDIGDEVNFSITVTNSGDRAGTLRSIDFESENDKIEYSSNLPDGGLAINGNDTNKVIVKAKVKPGAQNGKTTSEVKIKYTYDEGSCPDGEILSEDESMCLCPEGLERNEEGICVKPETPVVCNDDEIYNSEKKICEKKVVPVPPKPTPSNPKTLDNIILITLLFFVSGLGIYAVLFKKLKTKKQKVTAGVITGVATLSLSFTVLAGVFGLDNLLSAIVNPITKSKELVVTVNEEIDLIETWDGDCDVTGALTPDNIFQGGSGTESDPYQIKTANQLACFAKSVNEGETYEGKFIKQIKNIKLNDNLNDQVVSGDLSNANLWISAGYRDYDSSTSTSIIKAFAGTYDGDNHIISGLYITDNSAPNYQKGMFGYATNATFKNMVLSDVYLNSTYNTASLLGCGSTTLILDNINTFGSANLGGYSSGIVARFEGNNDDNALFKVTNTTNNIDIISDASVSGIIHYVGGLKTTEEPNMIFENVVNNGNITFAPSIAGGIVGYLSASPNLKIDNCHNKGNFTFDSTRNGSQIGGIVGASGGKITITNSSNSGDWSGMNEISQSGGIIGTLSGCSDLYAENVYNSGDLLYVNAYPEGGVIPNGSSQSYVGGLFGYAATNNSFTIKNSYNTGKISGRLAYGAGLVGYAGNRTGESILMENCYNLGEIVGAAYTGGLVGYFKGTVNKSYNKGTITNFERARAGGIVGWGETKIYNSYNEGEIINTAEGGNQIAGLCPQDCYEIKNSYNRGNITSYYSGLQIGGIQALSHFRGTVIENVYNSGNITYLDQPKPSGARTDYADMFGIANGGSSFSISNVYNVGDITIHQNNTGADNPRVAGISTYGTVTNAVNTGKATIKIDKPYTTNKYLYLGGISSMGGSVNGFNAGEVSIDDSALGHSIYDEEFNGNKHQIILGEITGNGRNGNSNNKFNTNSNGKALGCYGVDGWTSCTLEINEAAGTYTTEEAPDILSIINGDGAFNDELDEDGLPTLKAFNQ